MIPFFHGRMRALFEVFAPQIADDRPAPLSRPPIEYFRRFYADTSVYTPGSIDCAREFLGCDHVLFGTDAPFDATGGRFAVAESVGAVERSACSAAERAAIFSGNAERLFRLGASA
jgi:predicted TIM-barrel fold metal-dependent hydrolase